MDSHELDDMKISADEIKTYKSENSILGRGTYGRVHVCLYKGNVCAIKLTQLFGDADGMDDTVADVKREAHVMKKMDKSCYIIRVHGIVKWDGWMGIVMDYAPRNNLQLFIIRDKHDEINLAMKLRIIYQIALGLTHLHNCDFYTSIAHNDLSPSNILLDGQLQVKISDFGGSSFLARTGCPPYCLNEITIVRTANYTAPEYSENAKRTKKMDVFSFAIVIYYVLAHQDPFGTTPITDIADKYKAGERPRIPTKKHSPDRHNDEIFNILIGIMKTCWSGEPNSRPAINAVKDQLKPHNDRFTEHASDFVKKYTEKPVVKRWDNQPTISLESLCGSLNVAQITPPSSNESVCGQAGIMN